MNSLNSEAFALFGQHILWSDMVGNLFGLAALALGWRRSIWTWPVQFLAGLILFGAFYGHLTGSAGKQAVVMLVALFGWWQWQRGKGQGEDGHIAVRFATWRERGAMVAAAAAGTVAVALLFKAYPTLSWDPGPTPTYSSAPSSPCTRRRAAWSSSGSPGCSSTWSACP